VTGVQTCALPIYLGKTNSLNEKDLQELIELSKKQGESNNSRLVKVKDINKETYNLAVNNPNRKEITDNRTPEQILAEIEKLDSDVSKAILTIKKLL
jgi:type I restriction enzyme M protein